MSIRWSESKGRPLRRPDGFTTPGRETWASSPKYFYFDRDGKAWSRSMLQECGATIRGVPWDVYEEEPPPVVVNPWSIVTHTKEGRSTPEPGAPTDVENIPKLQETIPRRNLPETLIIHDPHHACVLSSHVSDSIPIYKRYRRYYPRRRSNQRSEAHLNLETARRIGRKDASHSAIFRAPLRLPPYFTVVSPTGEVAVVIKIAFADRESREMLSREGRVYHSMPLDLMEDWTGFHFLEETLYDGDGIVPVHAVIPRFYGYYVPDENAARSVRLSPILMIEDCGEPIRTELLTHHQRQIIYSFCARLHRAGVIHRSFRARNILWQPGPLSVEPSKRSMSTPSFRIVDFGRASADPTHHREDRGERWYEERKLDVGDMKDALYGEIEHWTLVCTPPDERRIVPVLHIRARPYWNLPRHSLKRYLRHIPQLDRHNTDRYGRCYEWVRDDA